MNNQIAPHLCALIRRFGMALSDNPKRLRSYLADLCPESKREISVLIAAAECRVPADIAGTSAGTPWAVLSGRLRKRLIEDRAITDEAAGWAINTWAIALGRQPESARIPTAVPVVVPASGPRGPRQHPGTADAPLPAQSTKPSASRNTQKADSAIPQSKATLITAVQPVESLIAGNGENKVRGLLLAALISIGLIDTLIIVFLLTASKEDKSNITILDYIYLVMTTLGICAFLSRSILRTYARLCMLIGLGSGLLSALSGLSDSTKGTGLDVAIFVAINISLLMFFCFSSRVRAIVNPMGQIKPGDTKSIWTRPIPGVAVAIVYIIIKSLVMAATRHIDR